MKNKIILISIALFLTYLTTSCGNEELVRDAKKMADLQCQAQYGVGGLNREDATIFNESENSYSEIQSLKEEMKEKYTSESDQKEFTRILNSKLSICKNTHDSLRDITAKNNLENAKLKAEKNLENAQLKAKSNVDSAKSILTDLNSSFKLGNVKLLFRKMHYESDDYLKIEYLIESVPQTHLGHASFKLNISSEMLDTSIILSVFAQSLPQKNTIEIKRRNSDFDKLVSVITQTHSIKYDDLRNNSEEYKTDLFNYSLEISEGTLYNKEGNYLYPGKWHNGVITASTLEDIVSKDGYTGELEKVLKNKGYVDGLEIILANNGYDDNETSSTFSSSSANCDDFLKGYEKFVNDYIAMVAKYQDNKDDMALMTESATMLAESTKWSKGTESCKDDPDFGQKIIMLQLKFSQALSKIQ